jgi:hypothetical protein
MKFTLCANHVVYVVAYCRIVGKRAGFTCILIYTSVVVAVANSMPDGPELLVSLGVHIVGCVQLTLASFKSEV